MLVQVELSFKEGRFEVVVEANWEEDEVEL